MIITHNEKPALQLSLFNIFSIPIASIQPCSICFETFNVFLRIYKFQGQNSFKNGPVCNNCIQDLDIILR